MTLSLLTTPDKLVNGIQSNVNAGRSQLPYTFQRVDVGSFYVGTLADKAEIYLDNIPDALLFTIGDRVYFGFDIDAFRISAGFYTVLGVNTGAGRIQLDTPYTSAGGAQVGWLNFADRENYRVEIKIQEPVTRELLIDRVFRYAPRPDGSLFVDIGEIITEYQEQNLVASLEFLLGYRETYDDTGSTWVNASTIQSLYAFKQMYKTGGSNLSEFLPRTGGGIGVNWRYDQGQPVPANGNLPADSCTSTWGIYNNAPNSRLGTAGTVCNKILNDGNWGTPLEGIILTGSYVRIYLRMAIQISRFVTAGSIRLDVVGIRKDGTRAQLIIQTIENVTGNFGFSDRTFDYTSFITVEDFVGIGFNFFKIDGDFDADTWIGRNAQDGYAELNVTYAPARLLTKFLSSRPLNSGEIVTETFTFQQLSGSVDPSGFVSLSAFNNDAQFVKVGEVYVIDFGTGSVYPNGSYEVTKKQTIGEGLYILDLNLAYTVGEGNLGGSGSRSFQTGGAGNKFGGSDPMLWKGWKRTVSCVEDSGFEDRNGSISNRFISNQLDINKVYITGDNYATRNSTPQIRSEIVGASVLNPRTGVIDAGCYSTIGAHGGLTIKGYFKVLPECENPMMLEYLNSLGAYEQHLFTINQQVERRVEIGVTAEKAIAQDQEFVNRTKIRVPTDWTQRFILSADGLTRNQLTALMEIKEAVLVRLWLTKDGSKYIYVVVDNDFSTPYETADGLHSLTVQIELPENFNFYEAKEYL